MSKSGKTILGPFSVEYWMKIKQLVFFSLLSACHVLTFADRISNFTSSKTIYDFEFDGNIVWVATSGGLFYYHTETGDALLRPASSSFPDPFIRALATDESGNLWVASRNGYLLMRDRNGEEHTFDSYFSVGWHIYDICPVGSYLLVAADKGVSLFDIKKRRAVKNATEISTFTSSQIYTVKIHNNTIYLGGESGVAVFRKPADSIGNAVFYDPSIWKVDNSFKGPVKSFLSVSGEIKAFPGPSAMYKSYVVFAESTTVNFQAPKPYIKTLFSTVTALKVKGNKCWIGTEEAYFFIWDGKNMVSATIPGPSFLAVNRVHVDRSGTLWVLPYGVAIPNGMAGSEPWWLGINTFNGTHWRCYGPAYYPDMGHMASGTGASAIMQSTDDRMWFGFEGGSIKCFDPSSGDWMHYCTFGQSDGNGAFVKRAGPCPEFDWGKCDAIAQDSAGYMWISSWNNFWGVLLCYKPDKDESGDLAGTYRRFPPKGDKTLIVNISAIAVDKEQNIIYGTDDGDLTIARYSGDPISTGNLETVNNFGNLQKVHDVIVLEDGSTLVLTAGGVRRYDPYNNTLTYLDTTLSKNITTLAVENDHIYWYGIPGEGLTRYDMSSGEKTFFSESQGLVSTRINDIFIDKKRGNLWLATDLGVSRLSLGYIAKSSTKMVSFAYPNPFSHRDHESIWFQNVPLNATLRVYSLGGNVVGVPTLVREGEGGAFYQWKPPSTTAPGTYFYAVATSSSRKTGKIILTP